MLSVQTLGLKPNVLGGNDSHKTRGSLKAARILEVNEAGEQIGSEEDIVYCMFNPYEYSVTKQNTFKEQEIANGTNTPAAELTKAGAQSLKLDLLFDTYEEQKESAKDVSQITNKLWKFMAVKEDDDPENKHFAPLVAFHWGVFYFISYIQSMTQKFTLFTPDGIPVRAKVNVNFVQYADVNDYPKQNPTSGSGSIDRVWQVVAGDRLDLIASKVYRDATKWRLIADYNNIIDPQSLRPGHMLSIPFDRESY
ncbi:MAG: LysM peptidoglycan-binding domain-containing protein [Caldilineaceae bacterium]